MPKNDAITFEVPNLDCASIDPKDLRALSDTLRALAAYAEVKADAIEYRLRGDMTQALGVEARLERAYQDLPGWARW